MVNYNEVVLETKALEKHFGGIKAVDKIDMKLYKNEILAVVGANGAGKSTLIKTITGVYKKNGGEIFLNGIKVEINSTRDAIRLGIETVYQDMGLIGVLDAPSNLFLGREKFRNNLLGTLFRFLNTKYMKKETINLLVKIGMQIKDIDAEASLLSGGQQQSVSVGRAIYWTAKIIIFDEPTNNLGVKEQAKTISLIKNIREKFKDVSIIIVSHNLYHVFEIVDRIVVIKNGAVVGERIKEKTNQNEIVSMIIGEIS